MHRYAACAPLIAALTVLAAPARCDNAPTRCDNAPATTLTLDDAVRIAMARSPRIAASVANAAAAGADRRLAESEARPTVSANAYLTHGDEGAMFAGAPGVSPGNVTSAPRGPYANQNVAFMAPIYTGGRITGMIRAARADEGAAGRDADGVRADVAYAVREAYLRAFYGERLIEAARARQSAGEALLGATRARFDAGKTIRAEVERVEAELAAARQQVVETVAERDRARLDLCAAMGIEPDSAIALAPPPSSPPGNLADALQTARGGRPEILAARLRLEAAAGRVGAARGLYDPQVYGSVMLDAMGGRDNPARTGYAIGLVASIPLVDGGARRAAARGAEERRKQAEAELRDTDIRVQTEVRQAWLDRETAEAARSAAEAGIRSAQSAYEVIALRVASGRSILVEQIDALAALTEARAALARAERDSAIARARILRAQGLR